jgi:hypothetical protein
VRRAARLRDRARVGGRVDGLAVGVLLLVTIVSIV